MVSVMPGSPRCVKARNARPLGSQGNRVNEFSNIFTAVSGAGAPARLPPKAAKIHPATYFGRVSDAGKRRQAGGGARPTENSLHPIALVWASPRTLLSQIPARSCQGRGER